MRTEDPFDSMLHRYRSLLFSLCSRFRHRGLDVDDLLQEATIAIWRDRERLLSMGVGVQQAALVWKIARNAVVDALRKYEDLDALPADFDRPTDDRTLLAELHEEVERLEEPDHTIVKMQLDGYSYEEIGEALDMTVKNVSVRLVRAKERLRRALA